MRKTSAAVADSAFILKWLCQSTSSSNAYLSASGGTVIGKKCAHSNPLKANYTFAKCKPAETKSKQKNEQKRQKWKKIVIFFFQAWQRGYRELPMTCTKTFCIFNTIFFFFLIFSVITFGNIISTDDGPAFKSENQRTKLVCGEAPRKIFIFVKINAVITGP